MDPSLRLLATISLHAGQNIAIIKMLKGGQLPLIYMNYTLIGSENI
jgi:hypothetical protein